MSAQWKSTANYWCKYCSTYVRDTIFERTNHEATGKHQGNVKRFLRNLHNEHEREEREKQAARREIARVTGNWDEYEKHEASSSKSASAAAASAGPAGHADPTPQQLAQQREQLAEMGVAVPDDFRPEMAMPGEWTVTNTRVIETNTDGGDDDNEKKDEKKPMTDAGPAAVVKKRSTSQEKDEEEAVQDLFKKPRRWGRDSKAMPDEEDKELDALLATPFNTGMPPSQPDDSFNPFPNGMPPQPQPHPRVYRPSPFFSIHAHGDEPEDDAPAPEPDDDEPFYSVIRMPRAAVPVNNNQAPQGPQPYVDPFEGMRPEKKEKEDDKTGIKQEDGIADEAAAGPAGGNVKEEEEGEPSVKPEPEGDDEGITPIVFKQKRPKGIRKK